MVSDGGGSWRTVTARFPFDDRMSVAVTRSAAEVNGMSPMLSVPIHREPVSDFDIGTTCPPMATVTLESWYTDVTVACTVSVSPTNALAVGVTIPTETSGLLTATVTVAVFPSTVAVTVATPLEAAVTRPEALTLALAESDVVQVTARPESSEPALSRADAVICCVAPITRFTARGATVTLATGTGPAAIGLLP